MDGENRSPRILKNPLSSRELILERESVRRVFSVATDDTDRCEHHGGCLVEPLESRPLFRNNGESALPWPAHPRSRGDPCALFGAEPGGKRPDKPVGPR